MTSLNNENFKLFIDDKTENTLAIDFSADVFIDDGAQVIAIELKSVRPNSGEMKGKNKKTRR